MGWCESGCLGEGGDAGPGGGDVAGPGPAGSDAAGVQSQIPGAEPMTASRRHLCSRSAPDIRAPCGTCRRYADWVSLVPLTQAPERRPWVRLPMQPNRALAQLIGYLHRAGNRTFLPGPQDRTSFEDRVPQRRSPSWKKTIGRPLSSVRAFRQHRVGSPRIRTLRSTACPPLLLRLIEQGEVGIELGCAGEKGAAAGGQPVLPGVEEGAQRVRAAGLVQ